MNRLRQMLLIVAISGAAAAAGGADAILLDGTAAEVGDHIITIGDVLATMQSVQRELMQAYRGEDLKKKMAEAYRRALDALIDDRLIVAAFEEQGGSLPEWAIDRRVDEIVRTAFKGEREVLINRLTQDRMTFEEWRDEIRTQIVVGSMRSSFVEQRVYVTPLEVRAAYERERHAFTNPEKVKLRMIVVARGNAAEQQEKARASMAEVKRRLEAGEDFAALARERSEGEQAADGGDWGWIEPRMLRAELASVVAGLATGSISDPIESAGEIYLLKVEERQAATTASFDDVRADIEKRLRRDRSRELYDAWVGKLRSRAYVRVLDVNLF